MSGKIYYAAYSLAIKAFDSSLGMKGLLLPRMHFSYEERVYEVLLGKC